MPSKYFLTENTSFMEKDLQNTVKKEPMIRKSNIHPGKWRCSEILPM